jgi:hypothetical protein
MSGDVKNRGPESSGRANRADLDFRLGAELRSSRNHKAPHFQAQQRLPRQQLARRVRRLVSGLGVAA